MRDYTLATFISNGPTELSRSPAGHRPAESDLTGFQAHHPVSAPAPETLKPSTTVFKTPAMNNDVSTDDRYPTQTTTTCPSSATWGQAAAHWVRVHDCRAREQVRSVDR